MERKLPLHPERRLRCTVSRKLTKAALCVALLTLCSWISLPFGAVSFTLQVLGVALCGFVLGPARGLVAVTCFLALGAVGVPVFSGLGSGLSVLLGPGGGFLWGFWPMVLCCGAQVKKSWQKLVVSLVGLLACHMLGCLQFALFSKISFWQAVLLVSLPYLWKDVALIYLAYRLSVKIP